VTRVEVEVSIAKTRVEMAEFLPINNSWVKMAEFLFISMTKVRMTESLSIRKA
jgi:hypothetical protein